LVGDVEGDNYAIRLLVKGVGDRLESLLASGIPYLDCDLLVVGRLVSRRHVVKTNSCHMTLSKLFLRVPIFEEWLAWRGCRTS